MPGTLSAKQILEIQKKLNASAHQAYKRGDKEANRRYGAQVSALHPFFMQAIRGQPVSAVDVHKARADAVAETGVLESKPVVESESRLVEELFGSRKPSEISPQELEELFGPPGKPLPSFDEMVFGPPKPINRTEEELQLEAKLFGSPTVPSQKATPRRQPRRYGSLIEVFRNPPVRE